MNENETCALDKSMRRSEGTVIVTSESYPYGYDKKVIYDFLMES